MNSQEPTRKSPETGTDEEERRRRAAADRKRAAMEKEKRRPDPLDAVEEADRDSFPASDPPSWTGVVVDKHTSS